MRNCRACHIDKPLADFRLNSKKPEGYDTICKACYNHRARTRYQKRYRDTPVGRANQTWHKILQRVHNKNGKNPSYAQVELRMTQEEFMAWAVPKYKTWDKDNPGKTPSINRIDPFGHYELKNLEIISLDENIRKPKTNSKVNSHDQWLRQIVRYVLGRTEAYDVDIFEVINLLSVYANKKGSGLA